ncbi:hypothetical protein R3P38DRAFT_3309563 [Favolaschia claudopus]|uniref:HD domain-containing protein n=1 Tax=Favolaschia claudopus TaxID=2862362 RepID=A0AAW0CQ15_9AGAR
MSFPKTFDAYVPTNVDDFFALAKVDPKYVSLDTLRSFVHSIRCYYFALAILYSGFPSETPGVPQITFEELARRLYHTCLLHDLGWTMTDEGRAHPAHGMTFELHGGIMAYDHLHEKAPSLDAEQVGDIVQSIVLHTLVLESGKSSATGMLMFLSAWFDVCGYHEAGPGSRFVDPRTVQEIEQEFPRGGLAAEGKMILEREFDQKPNCLLSHFRGGGEEFFKVVRAEPIVDASNASASGH